MLALRKWAKDPRHDLTNLPSLQADSLPPAAYERLIGHLMSAQQDVMSTWQQRLQRDFAAARDEHGYARTLVELRRLLARRIKLAQHPGLPEQLREPLYDGVASDIRRLQTELEEAITTPARNAISAGRERLLRVVRDNSLTAILGPGFPLESLFAAATARSAPPAAAAPPPTAAPPTTARRNNRRRVLLTDGAPQPSSDH
ncbi:hypothetical protein [Mycobacterium sp. 1274756.6]|uniref:hypothetical protein n=1 Tax=Mycobacterium sp. 1274756.6 TaxID=1834076 RepID=UPI0007FBDBB7|nr:hypothetical protein [Mycobacterium sp. 1274756.6]OBJ70991.1 hypothetical protein A5643_08860 [Mycobacterium sp. 1274756.6]